MSKNPSRSQKRVRSTRQGRVGAQASAAVSSQRSAQQPILFASLPQGKESGVPKLQEFLSGLNLRERQLEAEQILDERVDDIFEGLDYDPVDLGEDWQWHTIQALAESVAQPGIEGPLLALETALFKIHPKLSSEAVATFWRSRQVWTYLGQALVDHSPGDIGPSGGLQRRHTARRILTVYARQILQVAPTLLGPDSGLVPKARQYGPKPNMVRHNRVARVVGDIGPSWKARLDDTAERLDEAEVSVPENWKKKGLSDWQDGLVDSRENFIKAVQYSIEKTDLASHAGQ